MQSDRDPRATRPPHEMPAEDARRYHHPPSYELRTRERLAMSRLGAMTRWRSWATLIVGLLALALCLLWLFGRWGA